MKNLSLLIAGLLTVTLIHESSHARRDQNREARQQARIRDGVKDGSLTKREAHHLRQGQRALDAHQAKAMKDGVVTEKEAASLERQQDRLSDRIYKQKHDEQTTQPKQDGQ